MFSALENNKAALHISEYSVSQTTLEQIFNFFASQQEEEHAQAPGLEPARELPERLEHIFDLDIGSCCRSGNSRKPIR